MEIHAIIATSDTELIFLHECSPVSPITLTNYATFNLLNHLTPTTTCSPSPLAHHRVTSVNDAEFTILRGENFVTFIFCHTKNAATSPVIFCHKIKELFTIAFESITRDTVNQQVLTRFLYSTLLHCFSQWRTISIYAWIYSVALFNLAASTRSIWIDWFSKFWIDSSDIKSVLKIYSVQSEKQFATTSFNVKQFTVEDVWKESNSWQ